MLEWFVTPATHELYVSLSKSPAKRQSARRRKIEEAIAADSIAKIRHCTNIGLALGTEEFRVRVASLKG